MASKPSKKSNKGASKKPSTTEKAGKKASTKAKSSKAAGASALLTTPLGPVLRPTPGVTIAELDAESTPGWEGSRAKAEALTLTLGEELSELQERLYANGRSGDNRTVLLVLQGLDTSGKGGIVRHVLGMVDPQGVSIRSFGVPTQEELDHHYLWRIRNALPPAGRIGVFDRSHYEDVLVAKVNHLVDHEEIERRYDEIVGFEQELVDAGTTVIKVALVVSPDEQYARLRERLDRPDKHWKFSMGDLETRATWPAFIEAYDRVLERTSSEHAPWHVVPANRKWFSRLAVTQLLVDALRGLDLQWPEAAFDVASAIEALEATKEDPTGSVS